MRIESWNPNAFDQEFEDVAIERLVEAAEVVAEAARQRCPVGTVSRPMYKKGMYAGKEWTSRDRGSLKRTIRVTQKKNKYGTVLWKKRNVRVYVGDYWAYYARIVEFTKPFLRSALNSSIPIVKSIIGAK